MQATSELEARLRESEARRRALESMIDAAGTLRECGIPAATPESHALFRELVALPDRATMRTALREALAPGPVASTTTDPLEALGIPTIPGPPPARLREATRYTEAARKVLAKEGKARADGSYPIRNAQDVENAVSDLRRSGGTDEDRAHIVKRAEEVPGGTDRLPPEWGGSTQAIQESERLAQLGIPTVDDCPPAHQGGTDRRSELEALGIPTIPAAGLHHARLLEDGGRVLRRIA
ncbi:MAG: hypothetical protein ABSH36_07770 [Solirubrobacteraceae bacterium]